MTEITTDKIYMLKISKNSEQLVTVTDPKGRAKNGLKERMSERIMIGNHNSNNKKKLFSGITKKSPTNIIFQTENETCHNNVLDNN